MVMVPEVILQRRLSYEDYQRLPDDQDYEIIEGVLYVAPRPTPFHQIIAGRLVTALSVHVEYQGFGKVVPEADLIISNSDTYVSPDIMVFPGDRLSGVDLHKPFRIIPDLIVEVLSPTTKRYDESTKRDTYARLAVPHYWTVDPDNATVTERVLQPDGTYREHVVRAPGPEGALFRPALFPDLSIDLTRLFA